jgi:ankyrin repeat protein
VKLLLDTGADINAENNKDETALHYACRYNCVEITKLLLSVGPDINTKTNYGHTALDLACIHNYVEIIVLLLQHYSCAELKLMMYDDSYDNYRSSILAEIKTRR